MPIAAASLAQPASSRCGRSDAHHAEQRLGRHLGLGSADDHARARPASTPAASSARPGDARGGRDARHQPAVQRDQLGVAVVLPEQGVVHRLLDVHVLEVLGDEEREVAVEAQRERARRRTPRGAAQRRGLARAARRSTRRARRARRRCVGCPAGWRASIAVWTNVVLVAQVVEAEAEQRVELAERLRRGRRDRRRRSGRRASACRVMKRAQRLVDRRRRGRAGGEARRAERRSRAGGRVAAGRRSRCVMTAPEVDRRQDVPRCPTVFRERRSRASPEGAIGPAGAGHRRARRRAASGSLAPGARSSVPGSRLAARLHAELVEDVGDVALDRVRAEVEGARDQLVAVAGGDAASAPRARAG